ncbi:MAG: serine/threonine protein kinase, partial [Kiritimatiellae bacterium]|nr:serine/threonine protein kinase [Kiritimatiellia bacterium]
MPTTAGGVRPLRADIDEPSGTTVVGQGIPGAPLGQIDQYQLVRKLGGGGFGVVYLARDTVSGVDVALKTLHPLLKSNPEEMEALRAKFALVSRLSHTNIASPLVLHPVQRIAITDDGVRNELRLSPGDFIMVMRYAPGVTLSKWRRQFLGGIVPLDQALEVVRQVASALDYAHGEKIVHRDIKPANIMIETLGNGESHTEAQRHREDGAKLRVRILDFGLAAEIRSSMSRISTETGDTSGTRPYMAPEQWLGRKQDGRTDQYALACVAYELLSGAPPFAGAFETGDLGIMANAVTNTLPEEIEDVPAQVNAALFKALSKNQSDRFSNCSAFAEALGSQGGETISASEPRPLPRSRVWPWVAALAAAAVAAGVFLVQNSKSPRGGSRTAPPGAQSEEGEAGETPAPVAPVSTPAAPEPEERSVDFSDPLSPEIGRLQAEAARLILSVRSWRDIDDAFFKERFSDLDGQKARLD